MKGTKSHDGGIRNKTIVASQNLWLIGAGCWDMQKSCKLNSGL